MHDFGRASTVGHARTIKYGSTLRGLVRARFEDSPQAAFQYWLEYTKRLEERRTG